MILPLGALVPIVWILGGPGCGKSTQCRNVLQKYGFDHMSTGELLRDEVATGSEKGKKWQEMMNRGQLIPLNEVMEVLKNAMASVNVTTKGYLIDGFPRDLPQAHAFVNEIREPDVIVSLACTEETMYDRATNRTSEKRADDTPENVRRRITLYLQFHEDILHMFDEKVKRVNGEQSKEKVFEDISKIIDDLIGAGNKPKTEENVTEKTEQKTEENITEKTKQKTE